jgi:predicted ABC-type ATPase
MSRPQFILIGGPNGAGKTTFTRHMKNHFPNVQVIDTDAIAKSMNGSFATIDKEQVGAGRAAIKLVRQCLSDGTELLVESTISGSVYLKYARLAKEAGFRTVFIYIALDSPQRSAERVSSRVLVGGHNIPTKDIMRRYPKSMSNLAAHILMFDSAHIYDNSERYRVVASYLNGAVRRVSGDTPSWLRKYLP